MKQLTQKASVIIGFRDWGIERLAHSITSIKESFANSNYEIIISDLGSQDSRPTEDLAKRLEVKYIYTPSERWSRSLALNIGIEHSTGDFIFCTDADMLFAPGTLQEAVKMLSEHMRSAVFIQCRDLPKAYDDKWVSLHGFNWGEFEQVATYRPRWGMGGLVGFRREAYDQIGGFDERMHTYGGEDLDFAQRLQRSGNRIVWLESDTVRMYHIWHESSALSAQNDPQQAKAVKRNKDIVEKDPTIIRPSLRGMPVGDAPLVSVVISTYNRGNLISDSVASVLSQSMRDFELIIIDDGSTDNTREVVDSFNDSRIRYFKIENRGISGARNYGSDVARGKYIAVHDDDDIMVPDRLKWSLSAIRPGIRASFGSWVNFHNTTGELALNVSKKKFGLSTISNTGQAPGHSTWLVETELMRTVRYDETISSAVDHNLALRLLNAGVKWAHCGKVLFVRRLHEGQVTETDGANQKSAAILSRNWILQGVTKSDLVSLTEQGKKEPWPVLTEKDNLDAFVVQYLPDHLSSRTIITWDNLDPIAGLLDSAKRRIVFVKVKCEKNDRTSKLSVLNDVTWRDLATLANKGVKFTMYASRRNTATAKSVDESRILNQTIPTVLSAFEELSGDSLRYVVLNEFNKSEKAQADFTIDLIVGRKKSRLVASLHDSHAQASARLKSATSKNLRSFLYDSSEKVVN